jgi:cell division septation protein DedD
MQLPQTAAWVPLRNSENRIPPGRKWLGPVDPSEPIMITIRVRPGVGTGSGSPDAMETGHLREPSHYGRQELGEGNGADPADLDRVQEFASQVGLDIIEVNPVHRSVVVWGTAAVISGAFRVELAHYDHAGKVRRGQIGPVYLPPTIAHIVVEVSGLDDGPPDVVAPATLSHRVPRFTSRQVAIPLLAFLVGSAAVLLYRGNVSERSTPRQTSRGGQTIAPRPAVVPFSSATAPLTQDVVPSHPVAMPAAPQEPAELELTAWRLLDAGRLRDAQDNFLRVLTLDPDRRDAMRGLVAVRRKMAGDNPRLLRQQAAVYRGAVNRGFAADEYTPSALKALILASLTAAQELETRQEPVGAAIPVKAALQTPVPPAKPVDQQIVAAAPQKHPLPSAAVTSQLTSPVPAPPPPISQPVSAPRPTSAGGPAVAPPSNRLYMVRIGPLTDRDRATAIAKQLTAGGFPQAQVSAQTAYRVLSEPLPRQVAGKLAAALAARGFRTSTEALTGDTVQLVFGGFASQKDAETLSGRIAAAGYDAWIREAPAYTVYLGPYPQAMVTTITDMVRAGAPGTTVAADDASSPPSSAPPAAAPRALAPPSAPSPQAPAAPPAVSGQSPQPAPVRQASPPPSNALYMVRIGPVSDRDRAAAVAKQLSAEGFTQPQITPQTGYRVVSEPLPRKAAEDLVATLAGRGLRSHTEPLAGDSVQLLFGMFTSQKDAEALSSRIAAAGYDAWVREGPVYVLRLGPYPQASVNAITGIVRAGAPEATVATDPVSTP